MFAFHCSSLFSRTNVLMDESLFPVSMTQLHKNLGKIAETVFAAGDLIEQSYDTSRVGVNSAGFTVSHRNRHLEIGTDEGGRFEVQFNYRISNLLEARYDLNQIYSRADLPGDPTQQEVDDAKAAIKKVDLRKFGKKRDELAGLVREEIHPTSTRDRALVVEVDDEEFWDGYCFYDYLYPEAESYDVHSYRETVRTVYEEGVTVETIVGKEMDTVPEDAEEPVPIADSGQQTSSPAFQ